MANLHKLTAEQQADQRRLRLYRLDRGRIVGILNGLVKLVGDGCLLPDDAKVMGVHDDFYRGCLTICIHSKTYDVVPPGEMIPLVEAVYIQPMTMAEMVAKGDRPILVETMSAKSWRTDKSML
jgi:hypothetical protein